MQSVSSASATQSAGATPASVSEVPVNFNWNVDEHPLSPLPATMPGEPSVTQVAKVELLSECLRDGLQGIPGRPSVDQMIEYVRRLDDFGITYATVGIFPGAAEALSRSMKELLARMRDEVPSVVPSVLSLCTPDSLRWTAECKEIHPALESVVFMGSAPSRRLVQGWDLPFILEKLDTYIRRTVDLGIPVIAGTEHTSQTSPDDVREIVRTQVGAGAYCIALADTVGNIRPLGTYRLVRFVRDELTALGRPDLLLDWHGHRDTGNALGNAMAAISAGADRIHVVSRGVGERSGNTALEEVVLNLSAMLDEQDVPCRWRLVELLQVITMYQDIVGVAAPEHGVLAQRYSHTSSGIHTDAILKANVMAERARVAGDVALESKLLEMARTVYSAVDPAAVGGVMSVGVSPWSGQSSVRLAYLHSGRDPQQLSPEVVERVLAHAGALGRELTTDELEELFAAEYIIQSN